MIFDREFKAMGFGEDAFKLILYLTCLDMLWDSIEMSLNKY